MSRDVALVTCEGDATYDHGVGHPLEPLTAAEVRLAVSILKDTGKITPTTRFVSVSLKEPPKELVEQYDTTLQSVQSNPVYQQMVAAQANFEKLMAKVNERIFEGMKKGSASPIITLG